MNRKLLFFRVPRLSVLRARAAMLLIAMLCVAGGAWAQQALPYEYGFEDIDLAANGWIANLSTSNSGIKSGAQHSGAYGFAFNYSEKTASLISPLLTGGDNGVEVSFWYKDYNFHKELRMQRCMENLDWEGVLAEETEDGESAGEEEPAGEEGEEMESFDD